MQYVKTTVEYELDIKNFLTRFQVKERLFGIIPIRTKNQKYIIDQILHQDLQVEE